MTKARAFGGYVATTVLLLLGAYFAVQTYLFFNQPLGPGSIVIAWGIPTTMDIIEVAFAVLAVGCFMGAVRIITKRPRVTTSAA